MYVLAIDTSSPAVTAGLVLVERANSHTEVSVAAERASLAARGHGELLAPAIADCLADAGITPREVGVVVAGLGPGPFTGLRVGLVTAAAFADAADARMYGVCSLDAIAAQVQGEADLDHELLVLTDARRKEVYWARYDRSGARSAGPDVARPDDVPLAGTTDLAGAGAELYGDVWPDNNRLPVRYPSPLALVELAADRIVAGAPSEVLEPMYLRRPDAVVPGAPKPVTQVPPVGQR